MKREFKVVTISLDELEKLARVREEDLNSDRYAQDVLGRGEGGDNA
jgi:hypothetical protein